MCGLNTRVPEPSCDKSKVATAIKRATHMKCSKVKENHIIHIFAEQKIAIYIYNLYAERSEAKKFWGIFSLKTHFVIIRFDI